MTREIFMGMMWISWVFMTWFSIIIGTSKKYGSTILGKICWRICFYLIFLVGPVITGLLLYLIWVDKL